LGGLVGFWLAWLTGVHQLRCVGSQEEENNNSCQSFDGKVFANLVGRRVDDEELALENKDFAIEIEFRVGIGFFTSF